jgi:hypothetical protein
MYAFSVKQYLMHIIIIIIIIIVIIINIPVTLSFMISHKNYSIVLQNTSIIPFLLSLSSFQL